MNKTDFLRLEKYRISVGLEKVFQDKFVFTLYTRLNGNVDTYSLPMKYFEIILLIKLESSQIKFA